MTFVQQPGTAPDRWDVGRVTIDVLPDVALLEIFDCYVNQAQEEHHIDDDDNDPLGIEAWRTLVHVCRTWRSVVFGSPLRLNLRLYCTDYTPVREMLAIWPPLPIVIRRDGKEWDIHNIVAALEQNDRVCEISLSDVSSLELEEVLAPMQKPYLALTDLTIWWQDDHGAAPIVLESFLGGSAPRLRHLSLNRIPFPGLPKLLLSATHLVDLHLWDVPNSGYFTPEAIVTGLSTSTSLKVLAVPS